MATPWETLAARIGRSVLPFFAMSSLMVAPASYSYLEAHHLVVVASFLSLRDQRRDGAQLGLDGVELRGRVERLDWSIPVVQQRLGHADVSITLGLYTHVLPAHDRGAAEALSAELESQAPN